jgi:hypothetical protein
MAADVAIGRADVADIMAACVTPEYKSIKNIFYA